MHTKTLPRLGLTLILVIGALVALLTSLQMPSSQPVQAAAPAVAPSELPPGVRIVAEDAQGVTLELLTPDFALTEGDCQALTVPGYGTLDRAGAPAMPVRGALLGIPEAARVTLTVLETEATVLPGTYDLCPVATPIVEFPLDGPPDYQGYALVRDEASYAQANFTPTVAAELIETAFIRSQRVAQVRFYPFQYQPAAGQLRQLTRIRVRLDFNLPPGTLMQSAETPPVEEAFEPLLQSALLNYEPARAWRVPPAAAEATLQTALPSAYEVLAAQGAPLYKLTVNADGLYAVTFEDLEAAGAPLDTLDPRTFRLFNQGAEVAIHIEGAADGAFDRGDAILFYGQGLDTKYTATNVYWLTWGRLPGLRMAELDGAPDGTGTRPTYHATTLHLEQNRTYQSKMRDSNGDHWYWNYIYVVDGVPRSNNYPFTLPAVATPPLSATLRGLLMSYDANPEHHTQIFINDQLILDETWLPNTEYAFATDFPSAWLQQGPNTITVRAGLSAMRDIPFINWFTLDYYAPYQAVANRLTFGGDAAGTWEYVVGGFTTETVALLDITDPHAPARITGGEIVAGDGYTLTFRQSAPEPRRYLALAEAERRTPLTIIADRASTWRSPDNGADYIVISPAEFHTALAPLIARREAQGLRVALVDVQDAYDEFAEGIFTPEAIHDFVAYAYHNWSAPAPAYLLLVGDGHYDYRNYFNRDQPNHLPPYMGYVDPWMGETAADNRYVTVAGDDNVPDLHLGRLPARHVTDVEILVDKILAYEDAPLADWQARHLFIADNADYAGNFPALSDVIINHHLPAPYEAERVYLYITHASASLARAANRDAINAGALVVNYVGHGSIQFWASERLMDFGLLNTFTNTDRLPLFLPMNCYEGYYVIPNPSNRNYHSFGETVVRRAGGGAIASWSPTGLGVASGHDYLHRGIYDALFADDVIALGPATTLGKLYLYANSGGSSRELLDTYILFGDPALALNALPVDVQLAAEIVPPTGPLYPGDPLTFTLTFTNTGPATAHHVVLTDLLPTALTLVDVTATGATITPRAGQPFVWDVADLPAGAGGAITIEAHVAPTFGGLFTHTAEIATSSVDIDPGNNVVAPSVFEVLAPDLVITKRGLVWADAGDRITYTLAYVNVGTDLAAQVVITDLLPGVLLSPTVTFAGQTITPQLGTTYVWDVGTLPLGAGGIITVSGTLSPSFWGRLTNAATIHAPGGDLNWANNTSHWSTGVNISDLVIEKWGPSEILVGERITYTLAYSNVGTAIASSVVITELLPLSLGELSIAYAGPEPTPRPGAAYAWELDELIPGARGVITLAGTLPTTFTGALVNTAVITTPSVERDVDNNITPPVVTQVLAPDLVIEKRAPSMALPGERLTYTVSYANIGTALASQIVITDAFPVLLQEVVIAYEGVEPALRPGTAYVWELAELAPGARGVITLAGTIPAHFTGALVNTAVITTTGIERDVRNNESVPVITYVVAPDLVIEKRGPARLVGGAPITYVLTYANEGTTAAMDVVITDTLPAALTQVQVTWDDSELVARPGTAYVWERAELPVGGWGAITITGVLLRDFEGALTNAASIGSATVEPRRGNNHAQVTTEVYFHKLYLPVMLQAYSMP